MLDSLVELFNLIDSAVPTSFVRLCSSVFNLLDSAMAWLRVVKVNELQSLMNENRNCSVATLHGVWPGTGAWP